MGKLTGFDLLGKAIAVKSVENFRMLRKKGITIRKTADVIIATFCMEHRLPLLFSDKDFKAFSDYVADSAISPAIANCNHDWEIRCRFSSQ